MRRMTIYRSELVVLAAAFALPLRASAQSIQRPITQAQGVAQTPQRALPPGTQVPQRAQPARSPAPQAAAPAQPPRGGVQLSSGSGSMPQAPVARPATHVIVRGETLWALAQQFLGDPLLWPEIYRLNTNVVEDPHWIYPGEELRISAEGADQPTSAQITPQSLTVTPQGDTVRQDQPAAQQDAPATPMAGSIFAQQPVARGTPPARIVAAAAHAYRAVRDGEYYSAGFLTENQPLPAGRIVGNAETEMRGDVRTRQTALLYEKVLVAPPPGEALAPGDLLLAFRRSDEVEHWGQMIVPTGLLQVKDSAGNRMVATVIRMYGSVADGQELLHIQPYVSVNAQRAQPVTDGVTGHVIRLREAHEVAQRQAVLFIDRGANDGVKLGDVFAIFAMRPDVDRSGMVEQDQARAIVVNTRASTSTVIIIELYRGDVGPGSSARLIRRMPS
jgi:LysM repeat protein